MKRAIFLVLGVAVFVIGSKLLIEDVLGVDLEGLVLASLAGAGLGAAATVIALLAADMLPIPSSFVMILSGAVLGVWWGALVSLIGSIAGEWLGFELVRRFGRRVSARLVGDDELARLSRIFERHGGVAVAITRAVPVIMETMSVVAGLSSMKRTTFLAASLAGTAPIVVIYAYAGAVSRQAGSLIPAIVTLLAVAGCGWIWYRSREGRS
jgi:uncharacterized membrane protein YdjX (TVP38/TMEM64 family)